MKSALKGPRIDEVLSFKKCLNQLDEMPANEQTKRILILKAYSAALSGPVMLWKYRGLRPRLLTVAPPAPKGVNSSAQKSVKP